MGVFYFLLLVGLGTVIFKIYGHVPWIDALYLTVVSSSTVGYGERAARFAGGVVSLPLHPVQCFPPPPCAS